MHRLMPVGSDTRGMWVVYVQNKRLHVSSLHSTSWEISAADGSLKKRRETKRWIQGNNLDVLFPTRQAALSALEVVGSASCNGLTAASAELLRVRQDLF